ncbi:uncharacterized protein LOC124204645 [Daphnia pulex]|uniref:uncharacterized protein LOC124204645 n=1 Tax=Daphnia pulex TaxID=6669 RepID=UPI001EDF091F|nr:uncharacterized protein LOC124204645 [Daphnia pulex]
MERNIFLLSVGVVLLVLNNLTLAGEYCQDQHKDCDNSVGGIKPRNSQQLSDLSTDFEVGSPNFWTDDSPSQTGVRWKIEDINYSWELENPAPNPPAGRNYMRVDRGATLSFGVAVLRSPTFQIPASSYNDISISFDFWIRSKWPQFTNLELYLNENGNERLLVSLWNYSDINNLNWVTYPVSFFPLRSGSEFSLAFYAYCGTDVVDAVAIDNIRWIDASPTTTSSTVTQSTTREQTTVKITTTSTESPTTPIAVCGGSYIATEESTPISSPNYPNFYPSKEVCEYIITTPDPIWKIRLEIVDFEMEAQHDWLYVYDGMPKESPQLFSATGYPGFEAPDNNLTASLPCYVNSSGPIISIVHDSDYSPQGSLKGWLINFVEFVD